MLSESRGLLRLCGSGGRMCAAAQAQVPSARVSVTAALQSRGPHWCLPDCAVWRGSACRGARDRTRETWLPPRRG